MAKSTETLWWEAAHAAIRWNFDPQLVNAAARYNTPDAVATRARAIAAAFQRDPVEVSLLAREVAGYAVDGRDGYGPEDRARSCAELFAVCASALGLSPEALVARLEGQRAA